MTLRKECLILNGVNAPFRILHISDIHFSELTSHEKNIRISEQILQLVSQCSQADMLIAVTGDLVSRKCNDSSIPDALALLAGLRQTAPVLYSLGNHEEDLRRSVLPAFLNQCRDAGVLVLDNSSVMIQDILFAGLTLPKKIYKNPGGGYRNLAPITESMIASCIGTASAHPCVLLVHSPMGLKAYSQWGADLVLSGHVHGGIIRIPGAGGLLSPERKFFPPYTKGIYRHDRCCMNVSAGIGKFRLHNPAEIVCLDILPPKN